MHHAQLGAAFRCFPKPAEIYCQHTPSNLLGGSLLDGSCPQLAKNSIRQLAYWHDGLQRAHGGSKHIQAAAEHCDQNAHDMHHLSIIVSCVAYRVTLFAVGIVATVSPLKMNTGHLEILLDRSKKSYRTAAVSYDLESHDSISCDVSFHIV